MAVFAAEGNFVIIKNKRLRFCNGQNYLVVTIVLPSKVRTFPRFSRTFCRQSMPWGDLGQRRARSVRFQHSAATWGT